MLNALYDQCGVSRMVSICRSMRSRSLSAELVDGTTALSFREAFESGHVELRLDLIGGDSVLASEVEEVLDLFWGSRGIRGRTVLLAVAVFVLLCRGHLLRIRGVFLRKKSRLLRGRVSVQFGFNGCTDEIEGFVDFRIELVLRETIREFHLDRGVERLAAVFGISRDFLRIRCVDLVGRPYDTISLPFCGSS